MIKKLILTGVLFSTITFAATTKCPTQFKDGLAPDIYNKSLSGKMTELCFDNFSVLYSGVTKTPLYSAELLTRENMAAPLERRDAFHEEDGVPKNDRALLSDYSHSGYDRGHLAPSADMGTERAQYQSFSLANMMPQRAENNREIWSWLEGATRHIANKEQSLYVITVPVFDKNSELNAIGKSRVFVPSYIGKVVWSIKQQRGAVYITKNSSDVNGQYVVVSIAEFEKMASMNLFPKLSNKQKIEILELPVPRKTRFKE